MGPVPLILRGLLVHLLRVIPFPFSWEDAHSLLGLYPLPIAHIPPRSTQHQGTHQAFWAPSAHITLTTEHLHRCHNMGPVYPQLSVKPSNLPALWCSCFLMMAVLSPRSPHPRALNAPLPSFPGAANPFAPKRQQQPPPGQN